MKSCHERQALDFIHAKNQRAIDHAVNQQMMFLRIDVRRLEAVGDGEVQSRWRDHAHRILDGSSQAERHLLVFQAALGIVDAAVAHSGHVVRTLAVQVQFVHFFQGRFSRGCSGGGKRACRCSDGQACQRRAILEKSSTIRLFRVHTALLSDYWEWYHRLSRTGFSLSGLCAEGIVESDKQKPVRKAERPAAARSITGNAQACSRASSNRECRPYSEG